MLVGAGIERGTVVRKDDSGLFVVESWERDGVLTLPMPAPEGIAIGDDVLLCEFSDGQGAILCRLDDDAQKEADEILSRVDVIAIALPYGHEATAQMRMNESTGRRELVLGIPAGKDGAAGVVAYNLLDNSDFRNPVNQRGQTGYVGNQYTVDRWFLWGENSKASVGLANDHVALNPEEDPCVTLAQRFPKGYFSEEKTYTLAYLDTAGEIHISNNPVMSMESFDYVQIVSDTWIGVRWAALYEGTYTVGTLPPYVPKGYAAELAECRRYYVDFGDTIFRSTKKSDTLWALNVQLPTNMRVIPTVEAAAREGVYPDVYPNVSKNGISWYGGSEFTLTNVKAYADL